MQKYKRNIVKNRKVGGFASLFFDFEGAVMRTRIWPAPSMRRRRLHERLVFEFKPLPFGARDSGSGSGEYIKPAVLKFEQISRYTTSSHKICTALHFFLHSSSFFTDFG
jgi:hypothetical protein